MITKLKIRSSGEVETSGVVQNCLILLICSTIGVEQNIHHHALN